MKDSVEKNKKFNLLQSVNYVQGSIVSRQIMKNNSGNVTLFSLDEGQGLSEHTAPFDAQVHVLEGDLEIVIAGNRNVLTCADAIIMEANKPHALKALTNVKFLLTMIKEQL